MSEKWRQSEICIVIDEKSQDSAAKHLSFAHLSLNLLVKEFLRSVKFGKVSFRQSG